MSKTIDPDWPVWVIGSEYQPESIETIIYELLPNTDRNGKEYIKVGDFLENDDFYQGLCMITVIRRTDDGKLFGYSWWNDISKHGEAYIEPNGDEYGLEGYCEIEDDWDTFVSFMVWEPVEEYPIKAYKKVTHE